jgi:hypothetical protein
MKPFGNLSKPSSLRYTSYRALSLIKLISLGSAVLVLSGCSTIASLFDEEPTTDIDNTSLTNSSNSQPNSQPSAFQHLLFDRSQIAIQTNQPFNSSLSPTYRLVTKHCNEDMSPIGLYYLDHWISRRGLRQASQQTDADLVVVVSSANADPTSTFCDSDYKQALQFGQAPFFSGSAQSKAGLFDADSLEVGSLEAGPSGSEHSKTASKPSGQYSANLYVLSKNETGYTVVFAADFTGTPSSAVTHYPEVFALKTLASAWVKEPINTPSSQTFGMAFDVLPNADGQFHPVVVRVTTGSRADRAGIRPGDRVIEANQKSLMNLSTDALKQWAQQLSNSKGAWRIVRQESKQPIVLAVDDEIATTNVLQTERFMVRQQGIAP